jgi:hypothetical protein
MNDGKYIRLDVHQATISAAVLESAGKLVMECVLETKAATLLQFIHGLRNSLHVTFEEGTCAAWLHELLKPHVAKVLVCDPRKDSLRKAGNKNDRIDADRSSACTADPLELTATELGRLPSQGPPESHARRALVRLRLLRE